MTNKIRKGETMDFEEIDELNEEDMNALYNDIVEFADETHLACCWCAASREHYIVSRAGCLSWCRSIRQACGGWHAYTTCNCVFSC